MKPKYWALVLAVILAAVLIVGCSSSPSSSPSATSRVPTTSGTSAANQPAVTIAGLAFSPQTLTVAKGTTVTWTNNDGTTHTVTSDSGVWDSNELAPGKTFSFTFNQTGTFPYHCKIHSTMTAKVVVQ